jgi:hypothetical protein
MSPFDIVNECVSVFFQRSFPNHPICHELSLRRYATYFFAHESGEDNTTGLAMEGSSEIATNRSAMRLARSFTLITAVCAATSLLHQKTVLSFGAAVGPLFFSKSRTMLQRYEDYDIRQPDSTSLQVRMLFSTSLQLMGENDLAWHVVGEACLLARRLRLYSEQVLSQYDPLEATLLRFDFWMLYTSDCTITCTLKRAVILQESLFDAEMDLEAIGQNHVPLLDPSQPHAQGGFEMSVLEGFHLLRRNWSRAASLILAIRSYGRGRSNSWMPATNQLVTEAEVAKISELYSDFIASLDNLPESLQNPISSIYGDEAVARYQSTCFTTQRFRLLSMHYCTKLMAIHEASLRNLTGAIGLRNDELIVASEKINTARDFIHNLQSVPFEHVRGTGESGVSLTPTSFRRPVIPIRPVSS